MKIAIIGAMPEEIKILVNQLEDKQHAQIKKFDFYTGSINGQEVVVLKSGIGKVSAAVGVALLQQYYEPDYVINIGSSASLSSKLSIGDVVVSTAVTYHDVDVTAFGYDYGQVPNMPKQFIPEPRLFDTALAAGKTTSDFKTETGLIVSGDSFINDKESALAIQKQFPDAMALEMEAGAIAQTCYQLALPFVVLRAISDKASHEAKFVHEDALAVASRHSAELALATLKQLSG